MTICVAALCHDDKGEARAVVAADRMVTLGGFIEFEHAVPKMAAASASAVVMVAGDTLTGTRLAREVSEGFDGTTPRLVDIGQALASCYEETRHRQIEAQLLAPRGLSFSSFYGAHASLNPQVTMMLDQSMQQFNLGVELLLAGVDPSGGHLYSVQNPGRPELQHDVIGYAAIGSGAIHALQSMIGFAHCAAAGFKETVFRVYAAKRRSEVAPGVGSDIDLAVVSAEGVQHLSTEQIEQLHELYDDYQASMSEALEKQLTGLNIDDDSKDNHDDPQ